MRFIAILFFIHVVGAVQGQTPHRQITKLLQTNMQRWALTQEDVKDYRISDEYTTEHNKVHHLYITQQFHGIPVYNAIIGFHIDEKGNLDASNSRFIGHLKEKIVGEAANITAIEAVQKAVEYLNIPDAFVPKTIDIRDEKGNFILNQTNFSNHPVKVKKIYTPGKDGKVYLSWDLAIDRKDNNDYISMRIDANTGEVINQNNWTISCRLGRQCYAHLKSDRSQEERLKQEGQSVSPIAKGSYRVVALPSESPLHGPFRLVQRPANDLASPLGWHDNKSQKFTITRGNNTHAFTDVFNKERPSSPEPDGGQNLLFDFKYDSSQSAQSYDNQKAAVTNLFYMNNMLHDILYSFGFDEVAGNFQDYNFDKGGEEDDHVVAQAQDGSGRNNANFATPPDGSNPRMQMFLWDGNSSSNFNVVLEDGQIRPIVTIPASFGGQIPSPPIEGKAQVADDGGPNPSRACSSPLKDLTGKVAIIDRGTCNFDLKAKNAQDAGAIVVLVCGFDEQRVRMSSDNGGNGVTIPVFYAPKSECSKIRVLKEGTYTLRVGTEEVKDSIINDGDFDNGVIAHEFCHGLSNRLTGGPSAAGCLANGEQMGEGWSDFFSLALTHRPGDKGTDARGIGNYVSSQEIDGVGIRSKPYSTDFSVNDFTYKTARTLSIPHGLGSVWCMMLWEMYWGLIDEYGYDPDLSNKSSGNAIAIQLVIDGMKIQPCSPGFVDGRDAILAADSMNNGGANSCIIWKAFAKRGLGIGADQGSSNAIGDAEEKESFEIPPYCQNRLRIWSSAPDLIVAGEPIEVTLEIANYRLEKAHNVIVSDTLPGNTAFIAGSSNYSPSIDGKTITWTFDSLMPLEKRVITYQLSTDPSYKSVLHWAERIKDDLTVFEEGWKDVSVKGNNIWDVTDTYQHEGPWGFYIYSDPSENDQQLYMRKPLALNQAHPVLRFYHWYSLAIKDGKPSVGAVELSVGDKPYTLAKSFIRNGYTGPIPYGVFVEPFYEGFYGTNGGYVQSYLDLAAYQGEEVKIKFRFGNEDLGSAISEEAPQGWAIDDIELVDLKTYESQACIRAQGLGLECADPASSVTIVEVADTISAVKKYIKEEQAISLQPNPAVSYTTIKSTLGGHNTIGDLEVTRSTGGLVWRQKKVDFRDYRLNTNGWLPGIYFVKISLEKHTYVKALFIVQGK